MRKFKDYKDSAPQYITFVDSEYYPDYLDVAKTLYREPLEVFHDLLFSCDDSRELLVEITKITTPLRTQLLRIFRKYVSPDTSVEMLKVKKKIPNVILEFGDRFRSIEEVREKIYKKDELDATLAALLYEYKDRGQKGYELTEIFFTWFEEKYGDHYEIRGPRRAGKDLNLSDELENFIDVVPTDFVINRKKDKTPLVVGFARYDSDRGGSQEDDRVGGNRDKITSIITNYSIKENIPLKVLFLNDGPGLLLGSMWNDYAELEESGLEQCMVATLKMLPERLTEEWLNS